MNNIQNSYSMPPRSVGYQRPQIKRSRSWSERMLRNYGMDTFTPIKDERIVPQWLIGKGVVFFFISMLLCFGTFGYVPELNLWLVASISAVLFFYGAQSLSKSWNHSKEKKFLRNVFVAGLIIRIIWILYMYFVFNPDNFGNSYGSQADTDWYMDFGRELSLWIRGESEYSLSVIIDRNNSAIDDTGYPMWLAVIYLLTGNVSDVFIPFCVKAIVSSYCAICMYRVAKRHFGIGTARIAALFVCLNPNMIYWCSSMMKETEMVFVTCLAVDNLDKALSSGSRLTFKSLWPGILAGIYLFFIRTALGLALFLAVLAHIVMATNRVMSFGKKIIAGVLVLTVMVFSVGDRVLNQSRVMYEDVQSEGQKTNMEWRSTRKGGNSFAKYAGAAVFAPLIFTLPFPTFNQAQEDQLVQIQVSGGSYIKNILSFFVLVVMILMLISGEWRSHVFILAYTVGYLGILVMSSYAQSGRFHMPVIPMLMLFAAYGIQIAKSKPRFKQMYTFVLVLEVLICLVWNWFKLKGRGMI